MAAAAEANSYGSETGAELELLGVSRYFDGVLAVDRCDLTIKRGEIVALLGPSGCGKSTLLNLIAGFEVPDAGTIKLRGKSLNNVSPHRRNTAMVFQHYALFPHLTIGRNIAYGLDARRVNAEAARQRVNRMVTLLKLEGLERRYPSQLSGGQRQRVAIARALAIEPDVLLLDESFSALDRNLREEMQLELSLLLRRLGVTTILVTHDQREAFALADRIAVMNAGRIVQVGTPREMYDQPSDNYVLRFLGSTNSLNATLTLDDRPGARITFGPGVEFRTDSVSARARRLIQCHHASAHSGYRCRQAAERSSPGAPAIVTLCKFLGAHERIVAKLGDQQIIIDRPADGVDRTELTSGSEIYLVFNPARCRFE